MGRPCMTGRLLLKPEGVTPIRKAGYTDGLAMTDETETHVDVMTVQSTVDEMRSMVVDVVKMTVHETVGQVLTTGLRGPSQVSDGVRNGADAPATDRVGSVTCSDAHAYMPNMPGCMQYAGHCDGGGQCSHAHTDRPIMPEMHASMQGHAGNVPVQSDAAGASCHRQVRCVSWSDTRVRVSACS